MSEMTCDEQMTGRISEADPDYACALAAGHDDPRHGAPLPGGRWARWAEGMTDLEVTRAAPDAVVTSAAQVRLRAGMSAGQEATA